MYSNIVGSSFSWSDLLLLITLLMTGFYGGTGFFVLMGGNPAILKMSNATFAEYWQHTDYYMAARMRFFGPCMMLCVVVSTIQYFLHHQVTSFWLMIGAILFLVADLIIVFSFNHPLNQLIQSWHLNQLPDDVQMIKNQVVSAFWGRSVCMIGCFILNLLAFWQR
ncbi:hypothetical protein GXP67_20005 [Rhodocytophaga rosea]|uniref:DUF1772 domain-containing protein n=1 Tax=Rhodocytophaga rosea TaxID=2704465 RepID=A0A6C0GL78_9BACT|nr:hypothetical protein [Rhodocytophaga rosea]QHT68768.1 hypothetical protein GXP67_20005 [Rhodocytophaga rosea]